MKKTLIIIASALAMVGCANSINVEEIVDTAERSIGFSAFTHKAITKGSIDSLGSIEASKTQYVMKSYQMTTVFPDASSIAKTYFEANFGYGINADYLEAWNTQNTYFWPKETVTENGIVATNSLSFFTYGPASEDISFDGNSYSGAVDRTYPCLNVTVADENSNQKDILAAMTEFRTYSADVISAEANKVNIDYNHILSAVTFAANTKDSVVFKVREIKVGVQLNAEDSTVSSRLYPSGRYGFAADNAKGVWSNLSGDLKSYGVGLAVAGADDFVKVDSTNQSANVKINADDQVLMLIPQPIEEEGAYFSVKYDVFDKEDNPLDTAVVKYAPLFATKLPEWLTGKKYNYIFTLRRDINHPIEYTVQVEGWEEQDVIEQFEGQYISDRDLPVYEDGGDEFDKEW